MSTPVVSICMIAYNHAPFFAQAIEGVLMQKCNFDFQLVIGDDASSDGTGDICKEYAEKNPLKINYHRNNKNIGMMQNFKQTLNACAGKYIALCEGDDYWIDPYKLQKQFDFFEANPDYGMVHSDYDIYYEKDSKRIQNRHSFLQLKVPDGAIFENLLIYNYIATCTVFFRRELLLHIACYSLLIGKEKIVIEDFANISSRCAIYSSSDDYSSAFMTNPTVPEEFTKVHHAPVVLQKHVIVGAGSIILPGVTHGTGAAVGALSLVTKDLMPFTINAGVPAKRIKDRNKTLLELEREFLNNTTSS